MTVGLGVSLTVAAHDVVLAQQQKIQAREDQKENSTREAHNSFTLVTTGVGTLRLDQPVYFDCRFVEEPAITTGVAIALPPDERLYHLPQCTAGVYRWIKEPQLPASTDGSPLRLGLSAFSDGQVMAPPEDTAPMFYTGAYLYFRITVDRLSTTTGMTAEQRPPKPVLHQHVTFTGTAMKILANAIVASADDPAVAPRGSTVAGTADPAT